MAESMEVDVLVVGSGAGGYVAAVRAAQAGAKVLMVEKGKLWGGTAATSGGSIWIPNSPIAAAMGHADDPAEAFQYLRTISAENVTDDRIRGYIAAAPAMLNWMSNALGDSYFPVDYPDYYPEVPGNRTGFRTHNPVDFHASELSRDAFETMQQASPAINIRGRINLSPADMFPLVFRQKGWKTRLLRILAHYYLDIPQRLRSSRDRRLTWGTATLGRLRAAFDAAGGELWLNAPLTSLLTEDGAVIGGTIRRAGMDVTVTARKGVILASGGFERNRELRKAHLRYSAEPNYSGSQINNTGDGLILAEKAGVATANLDAAWLAPVFRIPGDDRSWMCTIAKALPHSFIVNQAGERYVNEAKAYHRFGEAMIAAGLSETDPSWLVFDATYRSLYPIGPILPGVPDFVLPGNVRRALFKARTLTELAEKIGVPPRALTATVHRFNANAATGRDPDFGRGDAAYDRLYGDPRQKPNPTLGPVERAPFYAMALYLGDIGTCGGLATDEYARTLREDGSVIPGLYAVGNCAATVMGYSYPGAGGTLGPAMTFAYLAAGDALGLNAD